MAIADACFQYLTRAPDSGAHRLRSVLWGFLNEVAEPSHVEIWSKIFAADGIERYTDILHADREGQVTVPFSSVLSREAVFKRSEVASYLRVEVPLPSTAGELPNHEIIILVESRERLSEGDARLLENCARKIVFDHVNAAIVVIHHAIIAAAQGSKDLTSFLHRCINSILIPNFKFEGVSIFYHEQKTTSLILGATTGIERQQTLGLKRSDIRYFADDKSYTARTWRDGREIVENVYEKRPLPKNTLGETSKKIHARIYAPLRRWSLLGENGPNAIGVLRGINANRDNNYHPLTVLEVARLRIFCDAASVMAERYLRAISILHDQERATHGYNTDLAAIKYAAENVQRWLGRAEALGTTPSQREQAMQEIGYRIRDILAVQDNMASQIITVMHHSNGSHMTSREADTSACTQPYTAVMLRLLTAKKGMSECYGRRELKITFAGSAKANDAFIKIPALKISVGNLLLVFRNLAENAIKYSKKGITPHLDISWKIDAGFVEFIFQDNGIGIPVHEHQYVLREGFRGRQAQELQLRGNGLGLAVSKAALEVAGGSIKFRPPEEGQVGSCFVVRVPM